MSRIRSTWLVARREILERGRSRGYLLSLVVTLCCSARASASRSSWAAALRR